MLNFILFQTSWFICVLGAANHLPWPAFLTVFFIVLIQAFYALIPAKALGLIVFVTLIGAAVDQSFMHFEVIDYVSHGWSAHRVPIWIIGLWMGFASALNVSLRWLRDRICLQGLFGAIGGPMAYAAAEKLGAVTIAPHTNSYLIVAGAWGVVTVMLFNVAKEWDGYDA